MGEERPALDRIKDRLTYANVMATIAVFIALGGGAYAAGLIGPDDVKRNAIRSRHIKPGNVKASDIVATGAKLKTPDYQVCASPDLEWVGGPDTGYYRDPLGIVHLQGLVGCESNEDTGADNIFQLPPGYRPAGAAVFRVVTLSFGPSANVSLTVGPDGQVSQNGTMVANLYLDPVSFRCAPSGQNGCP